MEKLFKLKENGTTVRTEILAGVTTFMTMAYIFALNPNLLTGFGANGGQGLWNAVFVATCLASGIGTLLMAFMANKPFAMSSGMGLNSFFATVVAEIAVLAGLDYVGAFQAGLVIILVEGIVFLVLSVFNVREKIVEAIPLGIRLGISPAIGLMLMNIGLGSNVSMYTANGGPYYVMKDFFGALTAKTIATTMGDSWGVMCLTVITMFLGVFVMVVLNEKKVRGNVLYGMLIASVFYWICDFIFFGNNVFTSLATQFQERNLGAIFTDFGQLTLFKLNFAGFVQIGWFTVITLIVTFCMIDMFDTIGTLVGTASRAGMLDEKGNMPNMKEALTSDAIGTIVGAATGTSTITTFVESASGVEEGGRTGLTAFVTGIMFILVIFLAPIAAIIPGAATSSALIYVGIIMISGLSKINWSDTYEVVPAALMLLAMPISGSIGHAIGIGLISYTFIMLFTGKGTKVSVLTYVISALFIIKFFLVA